LGDRVLAQDWARAFSRARRCLAVARALGHDDEGLSADDLALYGIVFDPDRSADLTEFLERTIGGLIDYDRKRSTDLVVTLDEYFRNGSNLSRTARTMHVHLNTLLKRLDRTVAVLGHDWRGGDDLALRLAVRLHGLRGTGDREQS
jgi:DNA-binding PucR family transcriptional regulator